MSVSLLMMAGVGSSAPALVTVEQGEDFSFLSLTKPEFDLSDRGAYRAGETLNATILARDPNMQPSSACLPPRWARAGGFTSHRRQCPARYLADRG